MTIDDVIDWIMRLVCNLHPRNRCLMTLVKIKSDVINELLLSRRLTLQGISRCISPSPCTLKGLMKNITFFIKTCNIDGFFKKKKKTKFYPLQLEWMQPFFCRIYSGIYDSNKFTSFTECLRQEKLCQTILYTQIILHTKY